MKTEKYLFIGKSTILSGSDIEILKFKLCNFSENFLFRKKSFSITDFFVNYTEIYFQSFRIIIIYKKMPSVFLQFL